MSGFFLPIPGWRSSPLTMLARWVVWSTAASVSVMAQYGVVS